MKKIMVSSIMIITPLVSGGGVFWRWQNKEIEGSPKDYAIGETAEGKIIENKRGVLTLKVPHGWLERKVEFLEGSVALSTPDVEGKLEGEMIKPPLKRGCAIGGAMKYRKMNFDELKKEIKESHGGLGIKFEEIEMRKSAVFKSSVNF